MIANVNTETGIAYGVISGHSVPYLLDDIQSNGENDTYNAYKKEKLDKIKLLLDDGDVEALTKWVKENTHSYRHPDPAETARDLIEEQDGEAATDDDAEGIFDQLDLNEHYQNDEDSYSYIDDKGNVFQQGWLGGAPLIWCIKTSKVFKARPCSPCVPNAGDLDTPDEEGGMECYGVPDEYLGSDAD